MRGEGFPQERELGGFSWTEINKKCLNVKIGFQFGI